MPQDDSWFWHILDEASAEVAVSRARTNSASFEDFDLPALERAREKVQQAASRLDAEIAGRERS